MSAFKKLRLDVDAVRVDSFSASGQEKGAGTVHGHVSYVCSGNCTLASGCDGCDGPTEARPICY